VVFIGVIITPGTYIFPDEEQQINAAVSGRNKSPQQLYDQAFAALSGKNSSLSATAAATYLRKAADSGHVLSQAQLGYLYREGRGVGKDFSKAIFWLDKAAQSGNLNAALDLGYYLVRGENGFPKDEVKAVQLWRLAADRGNATAQTNLGISYAIGTGSLPTDFHQAIYWYGLAAKQGDAEAAFQLAKLYDNGRGVPRDAGTAMAWYKESVRLGKNDGAERLAVLEQEQGAERSEMTNRVNVVVSELESRFPEFNPNSPRFNKQMVNAVLAGQASYIKQNYAPDVALRMAGSDVYRQANLHNRR
jgi:TPR repeat protein